MNTGQGKAPIDRRDNSQILSRINDLDVKFVAGFGELGGNIKIIDERSEILSKKMEKLLGNGSKGYLDELKFGLERRIDIVNKRVDGLQKFRSKLMVVWSVICTESIIIFYLVQLYYRSRR